MTAELLEGVQEPRFCVFPEASTSAGQECIDLAAKAGLHLDPWQQQVLHRALGEREDGRWSAFEVAMIVPRQNGKSAIFEARVLAGLFLFQEELIIYSAHEFKTAAEIFRRILALVEGTAMFRKRVKAVARSKGEEGIELLPTKACPRGQRLRFVARSTGSGRGFSGDCNIWDEAQHLGNESVDALMPTMVARPNPQLWYGGSAPNKDKAPCEQIARVRNRAIAAIEEGRPAKRLAYFEWSADLHGRECERDCTKHDDRDDPRVWAKTNPGLGVRVSLELIERLHSSMSYDGFNREVLGVGNYPTVGGGWQVIGEAAWLATAHPKVVDEDGEVLDPGSQPTDPVAFAIEVAPDRNAAAIAVAGLREDGLMHVEITDYAPGTSWVRSRMLALQEKWSPCAVALAPAGPAGSLETELTETDDEGRSIDLMLVKGMDTAAACGGLYDAVVRPKEAPPDWAPTLRHIPHPALTAALAGAARRYAGDAWVWDRRGSSGDPSPLIAVTLARWAFLNRSESKPPAMPWVAYV